MRWYTDKAFFTNFEGSSESVNGKGKLLATPSLS